jgi:hypothetical protein
MKRKVDEPFEEYKVRRSNQNKVDAQNTKGKIVWLKERGTYIKAIHGPLV